MSDGHTVEVHTTINDIDPAEWDSLCAGRTFVQHRWLRLAETVAADHHPRYLLVRREGRLVAAATGTLERHLQNATLQARLGWVVRRSPFLLVGVPITASDGLLVADQTDLGMLLRCVLSFVRRQRYPFCIVDHLPAAHPALAAQRGYQPLAWLPETRLDLTWATFED